MSFRKKFVLVCALIFFVGAFVAYKIWGSNTGSLNSGEYLYIKTGSNYAQIKHYLKEKGFIDDLWSFDILAKQAGYPEKVKAGKYHFSSGMSNYSIIRMLRSGRQTPVKLVINKLRTKQDFVHFISLNLEADSSELSAILNDSTYLAQFGLNPNTSVAAVIPDTYEFWWNTNADKAYRKFIKYFERFWNEKRKLKAKEKRLSIEEVITLASIVEEETNFDPEKPNIASVYLNRLKNGMKLQADPTVKFAIGDFTVRRINSSMTATVSPYNTYYSSGLPPGPICTPSKKSIDAVLNAPQTEYLYFCAKEDFSGQHRFSKTYKEHLENARLYQQALNERNIH